jgi:hypothetical protein
MRAVAIGAPGRLQRKPAMRMAAMAMIAKLTGSASLPVHHVRAASVATAARPRAGTVPVRGSGCVRTRGIARQGQVATGAAPPAAPLMAGEVAGPSALQHPLL